MMCAGSASTPAVSSTRVRAGAGSPQKPAAPAPKLPWVRGEASVPNRVGARPPPQREPEPDVRGRHLPAHGAVDRAEEVVLHGARLDPRREVDDRRGGEGGP